VYKLGDKLIAGKIDAAYVRAGPSVDKSEAIGFFRAFASREADFLLLNYTE